MIKTRIKYTSTPFKSVATAILVTLVLMQSPVGYAASSLGLGLTINASSWEGDNGPGNSSFDSDDGGQFALSLNYRAEKFYTGVNLQGGEYTFDSVAPDQFTSNGTISSSDIKVEHEDFDLLFGYYFWPNVSIFLDLKVAKSEWRDTGYEQAFSGLGIGVSGYHVINDQWLLFGSLGFVNGSLDDNDVSSLGDGRSSALVGGAVYQLDKTNTLNFGLKLRGYDFDFDDGNQQEFNLNGLFFGWNHVFSL